METKRAVINHDLWGLDLDSVERDSWIARGDSVHSIAREGDLAWVVPDGPKGEDDTRYLTIIGNWSEGEPTPDDFERDGIWLTGQDITIKY